MDNHDSISLTLLVEKRRVLFYACVVGTYIGVGFGGSHEWILLIFLARRTARQVQPKIANFG